MKTNESMIDRVLRVAAGVGLLYAGIGTNLLGGAAIVGEILGAILLLTGVIGFCPLYSLFKISTNK